MGISPPGAGNIFVKNNPVVIPLLHKVRCVYFEPLCWRGSWMRLVLMKILPVLVDIYKNCLYIYMWFDHWIISQILSAQRKWRVLSLFDVDSTVFLECLDLNVHGGVGGSEALYYVKVTYTIYITYISNIYTPHYSQ